jgi:hypothetical protein
MPSRAHVDSYTAPVAERVAEWRQAYEESALFLVDKGDVIIICDTRRGARDELTVLQGMIKNLYILCDKAQSIRQLQEQLAQNFDVTLSEGEIERLLEPLVAQGLMVREKSAFLSLAIPIGVYTPSKKILERLRASRNQPPSPLLSEHPPVAT